MSERKTPAAADPIIAAIAAHRAASQCVCDASDSGDDDAYKIAEGVEDEALNALFEIEPHTVNGMRELALHLWERDDGELPDPDASFLIRVLRPQRATGTKPA